MATQNPIESEGTYPLPEAQVDRFLLKVRVDYPQRDEEPPSSSGRLSTRRMSARCSISTDSLTLQQSALKVYVDLSLIGYAVTLAAATRKPAAYGLSQLGELISYGASSAWADRADPGGPRARRRPRTGLRARGRAGAQEGRLPAPACASYQALRRSAPRTTSSTSSSPPCASRSSTWGGGTATAAA